MWPREHGTNAYLAFPLCTVLVTGRVTLAALALTLAALAAFVAHEPLLVLRGLRGERRLREQGALARRWLALSSLVLVAAGGTGLWHASPAVRISAALPAAFALGAGALAMRGAERTLLGELVALVALVLAALPVALACGHRPQVALALCVAWLGSFAICTLVVRAVARSRFDDGRARRLARVGVVGIAAAAGASPAPSWLLAALLPALIAAAALLLRPPSPRHLRRVGFSLLATSAVTFAVLLVLAP